MVVMVLSLYHLQPYGNGFCSRMVDNGYRVVMLKKLMSVEYLVNGGYDWLMINYVQ